MFATVGHRITQMRKVFHQLANDFSADAEPPFNIGLRDLKNSDTAVCERCAGSCSIAQR